MFISVARLEALELVEPGRPRDDRSRVELGLRAAVPVIPIVPPADRIRTRRAGFWRSGDIAGIFGSASLRLVRRVLAVVLASGAVAGVTVAVAERA